MLTTLLLPLAILNQGEPVQKTDAEILKMGRVSWIEYYTETVGYSNADMSRAEVLFGQALLRSNNVLLAKASQKTQSLVKQARPLLASLRTHGIEVASGFSGGGTMWNPVYAGVQATVEESVLQILKNQSLKKMVVSDVTKPLDKMFSDIKSRRSSLDSMSINSKGYQDTLKSGTLVKSDFEKILKLAKTAPRSQSDTLLAFCKNGVTLYVAVRN